MSSATFYKWFAKYGGMDASMMSRLKKLEEENRRLKKMYAEVQLQADVLKEAMAKSGEAVFASLDGCDVSASASVGNWTLMQVKSAS
jgi:putative transposase